LQLEIAEHQLQAIRNLSDLFRINAAMPQLAAVL
jgi:hypothetical protein